jgi:Sigma-70, non-essential region
LSRRKIEHLVNPFYVSNHRAIAQGEQVLGLAGRHRVPRAAFLKAYVGHQFDKDWLEAKRCTDNKWANFAAGKLRLQVDPFDKHRLTFRALGAIDSFVEIANCRSELVTMFAAAEAHRLAIIGHRHAASDRLARPRAA